MKQTLLWICCIIFAFSLHVVSSVRHALPGTGRTEKKNKKHNKRIKKPGKKQPGTKSDINYYYYYFEDWYYFYDDYYEEDDYDYSPREDDDNTDVFSFKCCHVQVQIRTDAFPSDTSCSIKDSSNQVVKEVDNYMDEYSIYTNNMCLPAGQYRFTIEDSWGDGLTWFDGWYKTYVDYVLKIDGDPDFGSQATHTFDVEDCSYRYVDNACTLNDEWCIKLNTNTTNATNILEGLMLEYNLSPGKNNSQFISGVYEDNCLVRNNDAAVTVGMTDIVRTGGTYDQGVVSIDINENNIKQSSYWTNETETRGFFTFCVMSELLLDSMNLSVSYSKTKVRGSMDFEAGFASFEIEDITLNKFEYDEVHNDASMSVRSCICDDEEVCEEAPVLAQNSKFNICVWPEGEHLIIERFESLSIFQGGIAKFIPIINGEVNALTTTHEGTSMGIVNTRIPTNFFDDADPENVEIS